MESSEVIGDWNGVNIIHLLLQGWSLGRVSKHMKKQEEEPELEPEPEPEDSWLLVALKGTEYSYRIFAWGAGNR